ECLDKWLAARLPESSYAWLGERCKKIASPEIDRKQRERTLFMSYSACSRYAGKDPLALSADDLDEAKRALPDWDPSQWRSDHCARVFVLLHWPRDNDTIKSFDKLCEAADLAELEAFYLALPLLPNAATHKKRCTEGLRTNMTSVFCAIAHRNPYPKNQLDEAAWNQMVLKALFVSVALHPIVGLDERSNPTLTQMLCDYAHERWAAGRLVSPELWRAVALHPSEAAVKDLSRALSGDDKIGAKGAALAILSAKHEALTGLTEQAKTLTSESANWSDFEA
ncbi:MAG: EboA domain-containing protein, partial [Planctomycetota bacterium]|nr:EboA domain-containing protein [Planctomycetota bacterium]